jgi:hypothetical protein
MANNIAKEKVRMRDEMVRFDIVYSPFFHQNQNRLFRPSLKVKIDTQACRFTRLARLTIWFGNDHCLSKQYRFLKCFPAKVRNLSGPQFHSQSKAGPNKKTRRYP